MKVLFQKTGELAIHKSFDGESVAASPQLG